MADDSFQPVKYSLSVRIPLLFVSFIYLVFFIGWKRQIRKCTEMFRIRRGERGEC